MLVAAVVGGTGAKAQTEPIQETTISFFTKNIQQLSNIYFLSDEGFFPGRFSFEQVDDFSEKYETLHSPVFPEVLKKSEKFFLVLQFTGRK